MIINTTLESTSSTYNVLTCSWRSSHGTELCAKQFHEGSLLFKHLCEDHIGRKNLGNLCLQCRWSGCHHVTEKRDHIVSHVRVHCPTYRPFQCSHCDRSFSRAHDLRKHCRTHSSPTTAKVPSSTSLSPKEPTDIPPQRFSFDPNVFQLPLLQEPRSNHRRGPLMPASEFASSMNMALARQSVQQPDQANYTLTSTSFPTTTGPFATTRSVSFPMPPSLPSDTFAWNSGDSIPVEHLALLQSTTAKRRRPDPIVTLPTEHQETMEFEELLNDFMGSIKRKKLSPQYSQEMAEQLTRLANAVAKPTSTTASAQEESSLGLEERPKSDSVEQLIMSSLLISTEDIDQLNSFFSELYENMKQDVVHSPKTGASSAPVSPSIVRSNEEQFSSSENQKEVDTEDVRDEHNWLNNCLDDLVVEMESVVMDWQSTRSSPSSTILLSDAEAMACFEEIQQDSPSEKHNENLPPSQLTIIQQQPSVDRLPVSRTQSPVDRLPSINRGIQVRRALDAMKISAMTQQPEQARTRLLRHQEARPSFSDPSSIVRIIQNKTGSNLPHANRDMVHSRSTLTHGQESGLSDKMTKQLFRSEMLSVRRTQSFPESMRRAQVSREMRLQHLKLISVIVESLESTWSDD